MNSKYEPRTYWEHRLTPALDITTVGHSGLGYVYNAWLYKARFRAMQRALDKLNLHISNKSVVELGVGSGAWIPFWSKFGPSQIVGIDITQTSVRALTKRYPQCRFLQEDICSPSFRSQEDEFDIVTAFDVLFHITDDTSFSYAISNISKLVKSNGWVVVSDSFCPNPSGPYYHEYHRSYDHYLMELQSANLRPAYLEPIFFMMTTRLCGQSRPLGALTTQTLRLVGRLSSRQRTEWINYLIGGSLYLLDGLLYRLVKTGSSLKLLFAQKC
jgi:SAM-dependent methyltransferase